MMAGNRDPSRQANVFAMSSPGALVDGLYAVIGSAQRGTLRTNSMLPTSNPPVGRSRTNERHQCVM
jgi:hypothetical protein